MIKIFLTGLVWGIAFPFYVSAQTQKWGNLTISIPIGWSSNQKKGSIQVSNYNLKEEEPFTLTLFDGGIFTGKADSLFAFAWHQFAKNIPENKEVPRHKKMYTNEGMPIQQGFSEIIQQETKVYRQLTVFLLEGGFYQACLIETNSAKSYHLVQNEWQERLLDVKRAASKKK